MCCENLQAELAEMQQEQQRLKHERPLPVERLTTLEDSLAEHSTAAEKQLHQLSDTQQVLTMIASQHVELAF